MYSKTLLQFTIPSLSVEDMLLFTDISGSLPAGARVGLIGINGSGKSTLLKFLAGINRAPGVSVQTQAKLAYVPQLDLMQYRREVPLFEFLAGFNDDWWQVLLHYAELFGGTLEETRLLNTLSGGELVKLNIALALSANPDILLLDEPTNHLDLGSLQALLVFLKQTKLAFILVSHNVGFLNEAVDTIWELDRQKLHVYGGNYDFYKAEKQRKLEAQQDLYAATRKKLLKAKKSLQQANIMHQEKSAKLAKAIRSGTSGIPRIKFKSLKNLGEQVHGDSKGKLERSLSELSGKMSELQVKQRKLAHLDLKRQAGQTASGLLIAIKNGALTLPGGRELLKDINLRLYRGDRIAIIGDNGSGKTTLAKQLGWQANELLRGEVRYGSAYRTLSVDQKYELVDPELDLVENIRKNNSKLNYEDIRKVLGNLGFSAEAEINQKAGVLSGGETARLAFAIATSAAIGLLILDEPTNNLDIQTVERISAALQDYKGSLVVISHDLSFIRRLGITLAWQLEKRNIQIAQIP